MVAEPDSDGLTPDVATVRALRAASDLPLRVMLRANPGWSTTGSELSRLQGAAHELAAAGADGFLLGFVSPSLEVDIEASLALAGQLDRRPWAFHRAVDQTLDHDRAWRMLRGLPGLDGVLTAGSARGMADGLDDLCARAAADPAVAALAVAGGGLEPEHVPWLVRAGVRAFHIGSRARPAGSWKAYVDAGHVRSWRTLVDDAVAAVL